MVFMLYLWWTCLIWYHDWIGLEKPPQNDPLNVQIRPLYPKIQWSQLNCTVKVNCASRLDSPWKTIPKWPFDCPNPSTGSKDTVIFILKSADLYRHSWLFFTTGLALKNYPKMTLWMSKSVHWIKRYNDIYIEVSWFVQSQLIWSNYWIGLKKLPQNDSLNVQIHPLDQKIQWCLYWSQLICTVTADSIQLLDWSRKTTPKWLFECWNPSTGSKVIDLLHKVQEGY